MIELYLRLLDRVLTPLLLMVGVVVLLRGHDAPGGGFIAALLVSAAAVLQILANGAAVMRERTGRWLQTLVAGGMLLAIGSALLGILTGDGFFHSIWWSLDWGPIHYKIGTPVLFDFGVFATVTGATISVLLGLSTNVIERRDAPRIEKPTSARGGEDAP